jgi:predicted nucleic acid-binding protein
VSAVFWDTNLFIYLIEQTPGLHDMVVALRQQMLANGDTLVTSALTLGEVLTKPLRDGRTDLADRYRQLLTAGAVVIVAFDADVAERYARIRAKYNVKAPDALQLACAASFGVTVFYTNDHRLDDKVVEGIGGIRALRDMAL